MVTGMESQIFFISVFNSSRLVGGSIISIPLIIDHIISIGDKSGEFGGYLGMISPLRFGQLSHVRICHSQIILEFFFENLLKSGPLPHLVGKILA